MNQLEFLEELRAIAQLGLNYTQDDHDRRRYARILTLAGQGYAALTRVDGEEIAAKFRRETGHITPKVGVNAAIFSPAGQILLTKRADDQKWELPGGWTEVNESPEESLARELREEIAIDVRVEECLHVFTRMPGDFQQPHTSYHILYHCVHITGNPHPLDEVLEYGYFDVSEVADWHRDHKAMALLAHTWRRQRQKNGG